MELPPIVTSRKTGSEPFTFDGRAIDARLVDFWQWTMSDLINNSTRGLLAEFIVAKALDIDTPLRIEWDSYDLKMTSGLRIEVKSAAYIQSWHQRDYSKIIFTVRPTRAWQMETNQYDNEKRRQADAYIFALLEHKDQATINPVDLSQWVFYVLSTETLNHRVASAKTISLATLKSCDPIQCRFDGLKDAIAGLHNVETGETRT